MPSVTPRQRRYSLEYWAGFFDGEGAVWLAVCQRPTLCRPQVSLKAAVCNTHRGVIEALVHDFPPPAGRVVNSFLGGPKDHVHRRQQYKWEMSGYSAYRFLKSLLPYLVIKRDQALLALEFYELPWRSQREGRGGGWKIRNEQQVATDITYARRIKEMKYAVSQ